MGGWRVGRLNIPVRTQAGYLDYLAGRGDTRGGCDSRAERLAAVRSNVGCKPWSGYATMFHSDDDISLFVPILNIPEGLGSLFQGIASIDDRF